MPGGDPMNEDVLNIKLDHLQTTMDEVKKDVREIKDESPVLRIRQLEDKWKSVSNNLWRIAIGMFAAVAGAYAAIWFTR